MTDTATQPTANGTTPNPAAWSISWAGHTWRSTNVTTQQMCAVAETLGVWDWTVARPAEGPRQLATWIAILWASSDDDLTVEETLLTVLSRPMADVVNSLTVGG